MHTDLAIPAGPEGCKARHSVQQARDDLAGLCPETDPSKQQSQLHTSNAECVRQLEREHQPGGTVEVPPPAPSAQGFHQPI